MFGSGSVVIPVVGIFLVKSLLSYIRVGLRPRGLARRLGCKPVKTYQQHDKFLGLDFPLPKNQKLIRRRRSRNHGSSIWQKTGRTLEFWLLGQRMLVASDSEKSQDDPGHIVRRL